MVSAPSHTSCQSIDANVAQKTTVVGRGRFSRTTVFPSHRTRAAARLRGGASVAWHDTTQLRRPGEPGLAEVTGLAWMGMSSERDGWHRPRPWLLALAITAGAEHDSAWAMRFHLISPTLPRPWSALNPIAIWGSPQPTGAVTLRSARSPRRCGAFRACIGLQVMAATLLTIR